MHRGGDFAVAGVVLGLLLTNDKGRDQGGDDAERRTDEVTIVEAVHGGRGNLVLRRLSLQVQIGQIVLGAGSGNARQDS